MKEDFLEEEGFSWEWEDGLGSPWDLWWFCPEPLLSALQERPQQNTTNVCRGQRGE